MISRTSKNRAQDGVTLMLAVLVLSAITAIAFSLAAIVFIELGASGDLLRTEPALYAASGVTEEAFNATTRNLSGFTFSSSINNVSLTTAPRDYDLSPQTYVIYYSGASKLSLVDPDQPTAFTNSYTNVTLTYVSPAAGTAITANLYQYQPNGQGGQVDTRDLTTATPAWSINFASYSNYTNSQFELQLTTTSTSNATVSISSTRNRAGTPSGGLPVVGRKAYDVTASYLGLTRKYSVSGPLSTTSGSGQNVNWQNVVGVTASGNSLSKPGAAGWDAGASSVQNLGSGGGYVQFTASETNTYRMLGLSNGDSNQVYTDIDFALYEVADGSLQVYEGGAFRGTFGSYSPGDTLQVVVSGSTVTYKKNGVTIYTSSTAPTYPLLVDTSLYSTGATLSNALISGDVH